MYNLFCIDRFKVSTVLHISDGEKKIEVQVCARPQEQTIEGFYSLIGRMILSSMFNWKVEYYSSEWETVKSFHGAHIYDECEGQNYDDGNVIINALKKGEWQVELFGFPFCIEKFAAVENDGYKKWAHPTRPSGRMSGPDHDQALAHLKKMSGAIMQ